MDVDANERFDITVENVTATIQRQDVDGSAVVHQLPLDVLSRASVLQNAISEASNNTSVSLNLPSCVMATWMEGLSVLKIPGGNQPVAEDSMTATLGSRLFHYLQVC